MYLSSSSRFGGRPSPDGIDWRGQRPGPYDDRKLFVTTLPAAVARLRPEVLSNAVDPGWVLTNLRGRGAPLADGRMNNAIPRSQRPRLQPDYMVKGLVTNRDQIAQNALYGGSAWIDSTRADLLSGDPARVGQAYGQIHTSIRGYSCSAYRSAR